MSVVTGTATDHADLLNKLNTFLTVTLSPAWTSLRATAGVEMIWSAPGGGSDAIIVGAKVFSDVTGDYYNWRLGGFQAFNAALAFEAQAGYVGAGGAPSSPILNLWNHSIAYRFYATGRRVIVLAKVSTVYACAYLGHLAAYASPGNYPYPLVVGGSMAWGVEPIATSPNLRWSYTGNEMASFPIPQDDVSGQEWASSLRLRLGNGSWRGFDLSRTAGVGRVLPYADLAGGSIDWRTNLDGSYLLLPVVLADETPNTYGELDGIFALSGYSNGAENIITVGGVNYYVVPNVFRTTQKSYFCIKEA